LLITFSSIWIVANSYLEICPNIFMSLEQEQFTQKESELQLDSEPCFCEKKICALGIASVAIGIGGFILASIL
jgi:hypothetical protein